VWKRYVFKVWGSNAKMSKKLVMLLGVAFVLASAFFVQANAVTSLILSLDNHQPIVGDVLNFTFSPKIAYLDFNPNMTFSFNMQADPNVSNLGDMYCSFSLNGTNLSSCNGVQVFWIGLSEPNSTAGNGSIPNMNTTLNENNLINGTIDDGNSSDGEVDTNGTIDVNNSQIIPGTYTILVDTSKYSPANYTAWIGVNTLNLTFSNIEIFTLRDDGFDSSSNTTNDTVNVISEEQPSFGHGCTTTWICTEWNTCAEGSQTRSCAKADNACYFANPREKPIEQQSCSVLTPLSNTQVVENTESLGARITGAVIGVPQPVRIVGALIFIAAVFGAALLVSAKVRK